MFVTMAVIFIAAITSIQATGKFAQVRRIAAKVAKLPTPAQLFNFQLLAREGDSSLLLQKSHR
jgi:hypothetical protein